MKKTIHKNTYFTVVHEGKYFYVDYNRPHSGVVIILQIKNKILLVNSYRFPLKSNQWELPRGFIDKKETPLQAAKRELREETGYHLTKGKILGFIAPDSGSINNTVPVVLFKTDKVQKFHGDGEVQKYCLVPMKNIKSWLKKHKVMDGFTLSALNIFTWNP